MTKKNVANLVVFFAPNQGRREGLWGPEEKGTGGCGIYQYILQKIILEFKGVPKKISLTSSVWDLFDITLNQINVAIHFPELHNTRS